MKNFMWLLLAIILLFGISCQEKLDIEKEKEAIIKMLKGTADSFIASDMEELSAFHVQDDSDARLSGTELYRGWDAIEALLKGYIEENEKDTVSENVRNEKENILIKVTGKTAWVICDNIWKWEANGEPEGFNNIQIAFLEKIDGEWKISFNAFVAAPKPKEDVEEG